MDPNKKHYLTDVYPDSQDDAKEIPTEIDQNFIGF